MKNELWHLYYSGTDVVDQNKGWREKNMGEGICPACGNYILNSSSCIDLVVDQKIPKSSDMFSSGYLSPVIVSARVYSKIAEVSGDSLNFGRIYLNGELEPLETHYIFSGKRPWVVLRGDKPSFLDGKPVINPQDTVCPECGTKFGHGRGKRYINYNESEIYDVSWTEFGGLLIRDHVMDLFSGVKLKNVRIERVEIR